MKKYSESDIVIKEYAFQNKENNRQAGLINDTFVGIDEQKEAEEYLGHMSAIVESCEDAIISKSLHGTIRSWNKSSERMFGYTSEQAIGKHISLIVPPEYIDEEKKIVVRIRNNETIDSYETVRNKKNGEQINVSLTLSPLKDRAGNIIGISKIARDITSLKKSEGALMRANSELAFQNEEKEKRTAEITVANKELVFQNIEKEKRAKELIIANNELAFQNEEKEKRATELIIANEELAFQNEEKEKRAKELIIANKELAFQNEEKEKRAAELIIANEELAFQNEEKEKRAAELIIANKELAFQNEEKEKRAAELTIANSELVFQNIEKERRAAELIITNRDLKTSEQQFKEVNEELESFSYSVSHDLRAPVRAMIGYTRMLEDKYGTGFDAEAHRLVNNIKNNAKKMGQLIDDLLTFSQIGRKDMMKMNIQMFDMVTNICRELKNEQGDRNIEFDIRELLPAQADNTALKQVWLNLISNAVKYSRLKDKTIIEIGSKVVSGEIVYYIKDNGAGFDMRYATKLFDIFQRLHSEEEFEGTGIGLAIVHRIVFKHGGRIWADGKVNEGAIFYFTLNKL
jgi:PAS domain S-box-containing protein